MPSQQKPSYRSIAAPLVGARQSGDKTWMTRVVTRARVLHLSLLVLALSAGIVFYAVFRIDALPWMLTGFHGVFADAMPAVFLPSMPSAVLGSFPSFIAGFSVFMFIGMLNPSSDMSRRTAWMTAFITMVLFELGLGFYDPMDLLGTAFGIVVAWWIAAAFCKMPYKTDETSRMPATSGVSEHNASSPADKRILPGNGLRTSMPAVATTVFASVLAMGSYVDDDYFGRECAVYSEEGYCEEYKRSANPVYMSYENLRNAVNIEAPRAPDRIGRVYLYGNLVLLNEVNEGVHIIDNTEPTEPVNLAFIRIPGNTDIAVRDNNLYADSYVDLITLSIGDLENITLIGREQDIFPFNALQNIPQNITFGGIDIDRQRGVVVSYRLAGS